jgi:Tfp pilus assembly protein PilN
MIYRVNLVPQKPFAERIKRVSPFILGGLFLVLCAFFYFRATYLQNQIDHYDHEIRRLERAAGLTDEMTQQITELNVQITGLKEKHAELQNEVEKISGIKAEKNYYTVPLSHIASSLPDSIKCNKISFKGDLGTIEGVSVKHQDIPDFITNIKAKNYYRNVFFKNVDRQTRDDIDLFYFSLSLEMD